jgi:hypothetical protein
LPYPTLNRGFMANLGAGQVQNLTLNGVAASVSVGNTTPPPGAPNLTISR